MSSLLNIAAGGDTGFYEFPIDQSLRFDDGSSTYLSRTPASAGDRKHWTWSAWIKLGNLSSDTGVFQSLLSSGSAGQSGTSTGVFLLYFSTDDKLYVYTDSNATSRLNTNAVFRDTNAWYHIVVSADADNSTAADRIKIYVNGTRQTDVTTTYAFTNVNYALNGTSVHNIGRYQYSPTTNPGYFDGYMAEINFIDGTTLDPTSFAESKNGVWVPKDTSGLTFGSQGYRLQFKSSDTVKFSDDFADNIDDWTNEEIGSMGVSSGNLTVTSYGVGASGGSVYGGPNIYTDVSSHNIGDFRFIIDTLSVGNVSSDLHLTQIYLTDASDNTIFSFYFSDGHVNASNTQTISWGGHTIAGPTAGLSISSQYIVIERVGSELRLFNTTYGSYLTTGASTENVKRIYIMHKRYPGYSVPDMTLSGVSIASLSDSFWEDSSGNGNDWLPVNLFDHDVLPDSPTNNWAVMNNLSVRYLSNLTYALGNLYLYSNTVHKTFYGGMGMTSGKWYWEARVRSGNKFTIGLTDVTNQFYKQAASTNAIVGYVQSGSYTRGDAVGLYADTIYKNGSSVASSAFGSYAADEIYAIAFDADAGKVWFARNGTWRNGSASASTTLNADNHDTTVTTGETYVAAFSLENTAIWYVNFGQEGTFDNYVTSQGNSDSNGLGDFYYAVPSGFKALCASNLPEPAISPALGQQPSDHFNIVLYTGDDATSQAITGVGFQPDWVWLKARNSAVLSHAVFDVIRGANKSLFPDVTTAENSGVVFPSFDSDGFTVSDTGGNWTNENATNFVSWNWKAGGSASSNNEGTISSSVSANTKAGFSIVSYTGNATAGATVGHGLGGVPELMIVRRRDATANWWVYHHQANGVNSSDPETDYFILESTQVRSDNASAWNDTAPTSTVFTVGASGWTNTASGYIAYLFRSIEGYSKVGAYTAFANVEGPFIYTGFRPRYILAKSANGAYNWFIHDTARDVDNYTIHRLFPDSAGAENSSEAESTYGIDFLSNGFKIRASHVSTGSSVAYIYWAFAEMPFKYSAAR